MAAESVVSQAAQCNVAGLRVREKLLWTILVPTIVLIDGQRGFAKGNSDRGFGKAKAQRNWQSEGVSWPKRDLLTWAKGVNEGYSSMVWVCECAIQCV